MAKWKCADSTPVTTEREVRVEEVDGEREGYVSIKWFKGQVKFAGSVYRYTGEREPDTMRPDIEILDQSPEFV